MSNSADDNSKDPADCGHDHSHDHHHDHDHDHEVEVVEAEVLTEAIVGARDGLRSQVQKLVDLLPEAAVYIPLSEDLPDAPIGEAVAVDGDLTFRPHMILNEDQSIFAVAYSEPEFADAMQKALDWKTSDEDLKFICVPSHVAVDLCQANIDGEPVSGLVLNPGTDAELVLLHDEISSLSQGKAIPLVGYVADLPPGEEDETQVVEGAEPPPPALLAALERAREKVSDLLAVSVQTTFNPERDREPHLTITMTVIGRHGLDRQALADEVMDEAAEHLPAPGYADIVFVDAPN